MRSLYIHVPFCRAKCGYCAFYSVPAGSPRRAQYLARLDAELSDQARHCDSLTTVYVGGGTPSSLSPEQLRSLLELVHRHFRLSANAEFTVECNVGSLSQAKIDTLVEARVNRVSLGVQSFSLEFRRLLGREDGSEDVSRAVERLRAAGIENLNLDLIYGLPGQSLTQWEGDLAAAVALAPQHVSAYALSLEPGTVLAGKRPELPDEALLVRCWRLAGSYLEQQAGMHRYEVSNYARPGFVCQHNLRVWQGAHLAAAGPAAAGFLGDYRWTNVPDLDAWLTGTLPEPDRLCPEHRAVEILVTWLRLADGCDREAYRRVTGFDFNALRGPVLQELAAQGLLHLSEQCVRPTERGLLLADYVARELL